MPTLLQLNVCVNFGSTGRIAEQIGQAAISAGWDSYIVAGRYIYGSNSKVVKCGNIFAVIEHFIENRLFDNEGLASRCATRRVIRKIKKIQPDVIQIHNIHDHWINYKYLFEFINHTNIKVVWTFHDCWAFTGHCYHFISKKCNRWEIKCHDCPLRNRFGLDRSRQNYLLKKSLLEGCANLTIVSCSEWMSGFVKKSFLKNRDQLVLHNGIDTNLFRPNGNPMLYDKYRIIAVSNVWLPYKGINDLFKLRQSLSVDYEIVIVGLSEKQMQTLPEGIIGIQKTRDVQELVRLYSSSNVLVNPTYADTFPTVNLESLACGTPVVTYRTGGSPEAIDENTGIVVDQGDIDALCDAVRSICRNGKAHYLDFCRKRAEDYFDRGKCFGNYIELYKRLVQ